MTRALLLVLAACGTSGGTQDDAPEKVTVEVACDDGADDDGDGLVDCEDGDCTDTCGEKACDDGADDDADGVTDCLDEDCWGTTACPTALAVRSGTMRRAVDTWSFYDEHTGAGWPQAPAHVRSEPYFISFHRLDVLDLDAELRLGDARCGIATPRLNLHAFENRSLSTFQIYPQPEAPVVDEPCASALAAAGADASRVVRSLFFAPRPPTPDAWPAKGPLELRVGRLPLPVLDTDDTDENAAGWTPEDGSRPSWIPYGIAARYPVALHASTTASTPPTDDCTIADLSGWPRTDVTGCATATGPLTPATFPIDLTPRTLPEDATP